MFQFICKMVQYLGISIIKEYDTKFLHCNKELFNWIQSSNNNLFFYFVLYIQSKYF